MFVVIKFFNGGENSKFEKLNEYQELNDALYKLRLLAEDEFGDEIMGDIDDGRVVIKDIIHELYTKGSGYDEWVYAVIMVKEE